MMRPIPSGSMDLVYLALPFGSNRTYTSTRKEFGRFPSFDYRRAGRLSHNVSWITERIVECKRLLKKTGSIFLHCDPLREPQSRLTAW